MSGQRIVEGRPNSENRDPNSNLVHKPPPTYTESISTDFNEMKEYIKKLEAHIPPRPHFVDDVFTGSEIKSIRLWVYQGSWRRVDELMAKHTEHLANYESWINSVKQCKKIQKHRGLDIPDNEEEEEEPTGKEDLPDDPAADLEAPRYQIDPKDGSVTVFVRIFADVSGHIIGAKGAKVGVLARQFGVKIHCAKESWNPATHGSTMVTIVSKSGLKEQLVKAQLKLWEDLSTSYATTVRRYVDKVAVWRNSSDEERADFQSEYNVSVIEENGKLLLAAFTEDLFILAARTLENEPTVPRKHSEQSPPNSPRQIMHSMTRTRSSLDVHQDSRNIRPNLAEHQGNHQNYGYRDTSRDNFPQQMVTNLNRITSSFKGRPTQRTQMPYQEENYHTYNSRETVERNYSEPRFRSRSRGRNANVADGSYVPDHDRTQMNRETLETNDFRNTSSKFFLPVNADVSDYLNSTEDNNGARIPQVLNERFGVKLQAYPNRKKPGCTVIEFTGPKRELANAEDYVWNHLRIQQKEGTVVLDMKMFRMWRDWNAWSRTFFQNKTNVTVSTTDLEGELVLRAFDPIHLDKVQNILRSYARTGILPQDDLDLARKMWGS